MVRRETSSVRLRRVLGSAASLAGSGAELVVGSAVIVTKASAAAAESTAGYTRQRTARAVTSTAGVLQSTAALAVELVGGTPARRSWSGNGRVWIEVRGLDGPQADRIAAAVEAAVREIPGVASIVLNRTVSRAVVTVTPDGPGADELSTVIEHAEHVVSAAVNAAEAPARPPPTELPGDRAVLSGRLVAAATDAVGLAAAMTSRALRLPRLPGAIAAAVAFVDTQPRLRRSLEARLGPEAADVVLAVSTAIAQTLVQGPASLAVDLTLRSTLAAEAKAGHAAWERDEPALAEHAATDDGYPDIARPGPRPAGVAERYADVAAGAAIAAAATIGAATARVGPAADAVLVAAPRAIRSSRETFAATLGRRFADREGALTLRPLALRRLDCVDALVIDPHALTTDASTISEVRGVDGADRIALWRAARDVLDRAEVAVGWHPAATLPGLGDVDVAHRGEVLVTRVRDPLANAVVAAARQARIGVVSLDVDELGPLRAGFDDLHSVARGTDADAALRAAVTQLQEQGRTVALLARRAPTALAAADVAMALRRDGEPVPWTADVLLPDLASAWRMIMAIPVAHAVSRRGVELSAGGSLLGALLMLPDVRGRGPGPVVASSAAGLIVGHLAARRVGRLPVPPPLVLEEWHAMDASEVLDRLHAGDPLVELDGHGRTLWGLLTGENAPWRFVTAPVRSGWRLAGAVRAELADPLTPILATGAAASAVLGSPVDAILVSSVMGGNALLSATQRLRAERHLRRLLAVQEVIARWVLRDPWSQTSPRVPTPARRLQVGDVIEVRAGEIVAADARILRADAVEVDESSLTGESLPVTKDAEPSPGAPLAERSCMLYEGTVLMTGTATAVVTAVGPSTQAGRAAAISPAAAQDIGLQAQLAQLTSRVLPVTAIGGGLVTLTGLLRGTGLRQAVSSGVSIAVAAVPEGLPLVATLAQQAAARRLSRLGVLVRSPRAVEALGRVDVVCFDKTGTLSENRLRVVDVMPQPSVDRQTVLRCAALTCPAPDSGVTHATDNAVLTAFGDEVPHRDAERPFRPGRAYAAGVVGRELAVKGAPEVVLRACHATEADYDRVHELASRGLRVLAVARAALPSRIAQRLAVDDDAWSELAGYRLELLGLVGIADTPRRDAAPLVRSLLDADTAVRIITGDHPVTARAIAADLGIEVSDAQVIAGDDWESLSQRQRQQAVDRAIVYARMSPEQKVQVVQAIESAGHVCAMVGDGANDAAAIRAASVGIGVAAHGSDPARGAADVVLTDGRIASLTDALREGTELWHRVQGALSVLLGGNAGEVAFTLVGTGLTGRAPLSARQLLLVNMLTDAFPAAALAVSTPHRPATGTRGLDEKVLLRTVGVRATTTAGGATTAWALARMTGRRRRASTVGLVALVGTQLGQTLLDSRSPLVVFTAAGSLAVLAVLISTPGVSQALDCTPLGPVAWMQALGSAAVATTAAAAAPRVVAAWQERAGRTASSADYSTTRAMPSRTKSWYNQSIGGVNAAVNKFTNESVETVRHMALTLPPHNDEKPNSELRRGDR
jgi:cation-transporting P-type ATPase I